MGVGEGQVRDHVLRNQQPLNHRLVDESTGGLEVGPDGLEPGGFRSLVEGGMDFVEIDGHSVGLSLPERHRDETHRAQCCGGHISWATLTQSAGARWLPVRPQTRNCRKSGNPPVEWAQSGVSPDGLGDCYIADEMWDDLTGVLPMEITRLLDQA